MTTYNVLYIFLSTVLAWLPNAESSGIVSELKPTQIQLGEHATLEVRLELGEIPKRADGQEETPSMEDDLLTQGKDWTVLDRHARREGSTFIWQYGVTSYTAASHRLPPLQVRVGANTYSTEALSFTATTTRAEDDMMLREDFGSVSLPIAWRNFIRFLIGLLALALSIWGAVMVLKKVPWKSLKKYWRAPGWWNPEESPRAWLRRQLIDLRKRKEASGEVEPYLDELTWILKTYFEKTTHEPAPALTTKEFKSRVRHPALAPVLGILGDCDEHKFSYPKKDPATLWAHCWKQTQEAIKLCR